MGPHLAKLLSQNPVLQVFESAFVSSLLPLQVCDSDEGKKKNENKRNKNINKKTKNYDIKKKRHVTTKILLLFFTSFISQYYHDKLILQK
jgi:hypothetical protein